MLFPRPWKQGATKPLTHHPQASHFPSFPFSRKTDPGWQLASSRLNASFHGVLRDGGLPGYFWLGAFSGLHSVSGLKWPSLYLQNVNWRCHGDRTTLPGYVKIHFSLWVGRGQERNPRRCSGEDGGGAGRTVQGPVEWERLCGLYQIKRPIQSLLPLRIQISPCRLM